MDRENKHSSRAVQTVAIVLATALVSSLITLFAVARIGSGDTAATKRLKEISYLIERHAIFAFSESDADDAAARGYISALDDDYTSFWNEDEFSDYVSASEGNFTGIGVTLRSTETIGDDGILVYQVKGNSPAEKAGLKAGDGIVALDGVSLIGREYQQVYDVISSSDVTKCEFTVRRNGEEFSVTVVKEHFVQTYVESRMIGTVGFIRIHSFMLPAVSEFQTALNSLLQQGAQGFVFDLRNNTGGNLDAVTSILDLLIPKDEMVVLQYKNDEEILYSTGNRKTDAPMMVLINGSSASASELMASCLRDVNGSALIGTTSYGKGIGQTTFTLSDGSAVKMTTFYYLTKARNHYHGIGLEPDVSVSLTEEQEARFYALTEENDPQLREALRVTEEAIASRSSNSVGN